MACPTARRAKRGGGGLVHIEQSGRNPASQSAEPLSAASVMAGGLFVGKQLRGRWIHQAAYQPLRNAAWMVRRSRVGGVNNPAALQLAVAEVVKLVEAGEPLFDVMEAFGELLVHP